MKQTIQNNKLDAKELDQITGGSKKYTDDDSNWEKIHIKDNNK